MSTHYLKKAGLTVVNIKLNKKAYTCEKCIHPKQTERTKNKDSNK